MTLLCLARLQLCSLIEAATAFEMPASARFSHGSRHICQNTPSALNIYILEVFLLFSAYMFPRVFGDEFGDEFGDSL